MAEKLTVITIMVDGKQYKPAKPCKNVAEAADRLYTLNKLRLAAQKAIEAIAKDESEARQYLMSELPAQKMSGTAGTVARVQLTNAFVPTVEDKEKFFKWAQKNNRLDLMPATVNLTGIREIWQDESLSAAKRIVPGIGKQEITKLSCTKKAGK